MIDKLSATFGCSNGSNNLVVGSSEPDVDDYYLQNPHILDEGQNKPNNYGDVDLEDVDKEDYDNGSNSDGRPYKTSFYKDLPTCKSVGISDSLSY